MTSGSPAAPSTRTWPSIGPGTNSGTFDFFTDKINGEEGAQRTTDYNDIGEDDNATVTGVSGAKGGMGYFGFSFFEENQDKVKAWQIDERQWLRRALDRDGAGRVVLPLTVRCSSTPRRMR